MTTLAADATAAGGRSHAAAPAERLSGPLVMHTAAEAARLLKVKQSWLERQAAARKIPFSMLGGSYRFSDRHLSEIVRMNEVAPVQREPEATRTGATQRKTWPGKKPTASLTPLRPRPRTGPRRS